MIQQPVATYPRKPSQRYQIVRGKTLPITSLICRIYYHIDKDISSTRNRANNINPPKNPGSAILSINISPTQLSNTIPTAKIIPAKIIMKNEIIMQISMFSICFSKKLFTPPIPIVVQIYNPNSTYPNN